MSAEGHITGNNGEWSEQYVMYYLLTNKVLRGSNKKLEHTGIDMPLVKVIRDENGSTMTYCPGKKVRIYKDNKLVKEIAEIEFETNANTLKEAILTKKGTIKSSQGAFAVPVTESFMKTIFCDKLKSDSDNKRDITLEVHDIMTNADLTEGFSIKSYLGADPTLINPSDATKFRYEIVGCTDKIMNSINGIEKNYIGRITGLKDKGCKLKFKELVNEQFGKNLRMLDENLINILQGMLVRHFAGECSSVKAMVGWYEEHDPLKKNIPNFYSFKMKQLLSAYALGMVSTTPWAGDEDANGGFIVVKPEGDVVCFFIYDRKQLYDYLLECTKFDRPSSSKYGDYMEIRKKDGKYYLDLCLQIRFVKPGHKFRE